MCGICGFIRSEPRQGNDLVIKAMAATIWHRGNEASGVFVEPELAFGHQRLSILDLDARSNQPMVSGNKRFVITFNGEIYNFRELRSRLHGKSLHTTSDTEVLLELWAQYGPACLADLNGMFAFAVYDRALKELYCVRDRLGIKPLVYWGNGSNFAFASEAKALLKYPDCSNQIDYAALSDYLSLGYITGEATIYAGMQKLSPGHYLKIANGKVRKICYWDIAQKLGSARENAAGDEIMSLLESAVKYRLISDVPVGSFLSGGIDSAAVTTLAARHCSDIQTFTIGFNEASFDESANAAELSKSLGLPNHVDFFNEPDLAFLQHLVKYFDQPFADTSALPFFQLCSNTSRNIKTVMCGDGGDELFAGYETRRADLFALAGYRNFPFWNGFLQLASRLVNLIPADRGKVSMHYKVRQFCEFAHLPPPQSHFSWRLLFNEDEKRTLLGAQINEQLKNHQTWNNYASLFAKVEKLPMLQQQAIVDLQTWLADDILYKADQASMAHTLEVRAPFLDYRLVEAAFAIPEKLKFNARTTKTLLRRKLSAILPAHVLKRKKEGFGSPVSIWLEGRLAENFLDSMHDRQFKEVFPDTAGIVKLYDEHCARKRDNGYRLWALFMFALWQKEWQQS
ncbi:MAG: asparagine synthase (glutamine-hydrolyzing) [Candidatus Riflebacteria bacterium HGW-Riflebacteria-2]|jgi:asparagine synthase (glutamine-hydrolysing)|nr:MAG: asparagine synthase (glutamine-hydrolyzing) [Candidatus Riflebacteria bacterium HGW-Riflebacteria-2]